jgi:cobalt-zinc-cadmium efflux system protein
MPEAAHVHHQEESGHNHEHGATGAAKNQRALTIALGLTGAFVLVEATGGLLTGSLALLADAGHTLTDVLGLGMALTAIWLAKRPATLARTYGLYRAEMLAALLNSLLPFGIAAFILYEAWQRFRTPHPVQSLPMLAVALVGLLVNLIGVRLLHHGAGESLNVRGAFLEALADLLGATGVLVAALVMLLTGWRLIDPLVSVAIGLFILPRAWQLLVRVLDVLLEGTPRDLDLTALNVALRAVPGVVGVHDMHVWTITSGFVAMSGHVEVDERDNGEALQDLQSILRNQFGIEHATLQLERAGHAGDGMYCTIDPRCVPSIQCQPMSGITEPKPLTRLQE